MCLSLFKVQSVISDGKKPPIPCEFVPENYSFSSLTDSLPVFSVKENFLQNYQKVFISVLCTSYQIKLTWSTTLFKALQYIYI